MGLWCTLLHHFVIGRAMLQETPTSQSSIAGSELMSSRPLAHEILGTGSTVTLLLHGLLGSKRNLRSLARRWAAVDTGRRFVLVDLTGHGGSPPLPPGASLSDVAGDVLALCRTLGGPPYDLAGHSLGGRVALAALEQAGDETGRLVLLDISPSPSCCHLTAEVMRALVEAPARFARLKEARAFLMEKGLSRSLAGWLALNLGPAGGGGFEWTVDREVIAAFHARQSAVDLWHVLETHRKPSTDVTCIRGGASLYVTKDDAARMRAAGAHVRTLPDTGHLLHIDAADRLLVLLREDAEASEGSASRR